MRKTLAVIITACTLAVTGCSTSLQTKALKRTFSSFDQPSEHLAKDLLPIPGGKIDFQGVPLEQVLSVYASISGRTILRGNLPNATISFKSTSPFNKIQLLQMLDTVLAQHGIAMVLSGEDAVKAVPAREANAATPPEINLPWKLLPESSSMMMRTVYLKKLKPSEIIPVLAGFAGTPNTIMGVDSQQLIVFRDYSANIRRQLRLLEELEQKQSP